MAPIDLRLGQNAFQVIPELSFFDLEDRKKFGFFGLNHVVPAWTRVSWPGPMCLGPRYMCLGPCLGPRHMCLGPRHMCLGPRHMCPGQEKLIETKKSENFSVFDVKK